MVFLIEKMGLMIHWWIIGALILLSAVLFWKYFLHRLKRSGWLEFLYLFQAAALVLSFIMFLIGIGSLFREMEYEKITQSFTMWGHGVAGLYLEIILKTTVPFLWLSGIILHIFRKWKWKKNERKLYAFNEVIADPVTQDIFSAVVQKNGLRREPMLFQNQAVRIPFLKGIIHPVVIIPEKEFSNEEKTLIFAHELHHLKMGDLLVRYLLELIFLIYWFIPFEEYWLEELIEIQETLCDISVCNLFGESFSAESYFSMILHISSGTEKISGKRNRGIRLLEDIGYLEKRVMNMLGHQEHKQNWLYHMGSCAMIGLVLSMVMCTSILDYSKIFHRKGNSVAVVTETKDNDSARMKSSASTEAQYLLQWNDPAEYRLKPGEMVASNSFVGEEAENLVICAVGEHKDYSICLEYNNEIMEIEAENDTTSLNLEMEEKEYVLSFVNTGEENLKIFLYCNY